MCGTSTCATCINTCSIRTRASSLRILLTHLDMSILRQLLRAKVAGGAAAAVLVSAGFATESHAQAVGISLIPTIQRIEWDNDLPFQTDDLYGGRLALRFGKYVELQPFYFTRDGYGVDSARAATVFGPASASRGIDLRHYGTNVQFNLGDNAITPFVRAGAGVLRLKPDSAARQDRITVTAGGGLRFGIAGLNAEVFAEQMAFRMNPRALFGPDSAFSGSLPTFRNLVYGAAITVPLSTTPEVDDMDGGLRGSTAPIEPFVGVLRYASENNLPNQEIAGIRAGIDFSQVFGLRGFYWRGLNDDRDGTVDVTGYGGEAQFNLNTGPGLSPYLIVGAGQVDYGDKFADSLGDSRVDKTAFIIGGGGSFRVTDRIRINGAIRDYIMTVDDDLDNLGSTGDLTHNTMLTAGLTISIGGSSTSAADNRERQRDRELRALREERDRREAREGRYGRDDLTERERMLDRELMVERERLDARGSRMTRDSIRMFRDSSIITREGRWITIPVPEQGEIILRYGMPPRTGSDSAARRDSVIVSPPSDDLAARLLEIERRLTARIDAMQQQPAQRPGAPTVTMVTPPSNIVVDTDRANMPVFQRLGQTRRSDLQPYLGLGINDGDAQLIGGVRADLGPISPNSGLNFVPELAVGIGSGPLSVLAFANVQYKFGAIGGNSNFRPYATVGGGIFSPSVLGINTAVGSSFSLRSDTDAPLMLNVELQGINLFNHTRVLFGLSRGR